MDTSSNNSWLWVGKLYLVPGNVMSSIASCVKDNIIYKNVFKTKLSPGSRYFDFDNIFLSSDMMRVAMLRFSLSR
jgi:hypothetical protein